MSTGKYVSSFWRIILPSSGGSNSPRGERLFFSRALHSFGTSYGVTTQNTWLLKMCSCRVLQKVYFDGVWLVVVHCLFRLAFHKFIFRVTKMYVDYSKRHSVSLVAARQTVLSVSFRFLWPCIVSKLWSERENQQDARVSGLFSTISQHVSGIMLRCNKRGKLDISLRH